MADVPAAPANIAETSRELKADLDSYRLLPIMMILTHEAGAGGAHDNAPTVPRRTLAGSALEVFAAVHASTS